MRGTKTAVWRNALGQEIVFDNMEFFIENIDMTGTAGVHTVETLAFADGQATVAHQLAAKTIPCSFAWWDKTNDPYLHEWLTQLFSPLSMGTLTVYTRDHTYAIDCYPQDVPVFKQDAGVLNVWRWDVDFVADFPYWRKDTQRKYQLTASRPTFTSSCPFVIAPDIYLPSCGHTLLFSINGKGLTIDTHNFDIIVKTQSLEIVKQSDGTNCNELIDGNENIDELRIVYGSNTIVCAEQQGSVTSWQNTVLKYYELSMGEV